MYVHALQGVHASKLRGGYINRLLLLTLLLLILDLGIGGEASKTTVA
jgi:hypothetical protein